MDSSVVFGSIAVLLALVFVVITVKTSKTRTLRITLADNSIIEVIRKRNDVFNDIKDMKCYREGTKLIWLANHWIIKIEEI